MRRTLIVLQVIRFQSKVRANNRFGEIMEEDSEESSDPESEKGVRIQIKNQDKIQQTTEEPGVVKQDINGGIKTNE
jgi:hypothetical protein